jgi:hypothetical protein
VETPSKVFITLSYSKKKQKKNWEIEHRTVQAAVNKVQIFNIQNIQISISRNRQKSKKFNPKKNNPEKQKPRFFLFLKSF